MLLEELDQQGPRDQGVHALQKLLAPRLALLVLVFQVGKAQLVHRIQSREKRCRYYRKWRLIQSSPSTRVEAQTGDLA